MEQETLLQQLLSFTESKDSQLYSKAKIVLESIRDTLQKKGIFDEKKMGTAIFGSLFQMIQQDIEQNNIEQEEPKLLLFNQILTKVKIEIVVSLQESIRSIVFKLLEQNGRTQMTQKFALAILVELLQIQNVLDLNNLGLQKLVENITNEHVAARKQSWNGLSLLLNQKISSKFAIGTVIARKLVEILQNSQDDANCIIITQYLNSSVASLPINNVNDIAFALLKRLKLTPDHTLEVHIYLSFENIMKQRQLGFDNCETLIKEFIDNQPSLHSDEKVVMSYCQCLSSTIILMHDHNQRETKKYLPTVISILQEVILSENIKLSVFGQKQLEVIIISTVDEYLWKLPGKEDFNFEELDNLEVEESGGDNAFDKIISMLHHMLSSRFEKRQQQVHGVLGVFFQKIDMTCMDKIEPIVRDLVETRLERHPSSYEKCMAKLISKIGASSIVKRFPLRLGGMDPLAEDFEALSNFWMLPMFLKYTRNQLIEDFVEYFIPHISTITNGMNVYSKNMNTQEKVMYSLFLQLWECFGMFYIVSGDKGFNALNLIIDNIETQLSDQNPHFNSVIRGLEHCFKFISQAKKVPETTVTRAQKIIKAMHTILMPGKPSAKTILSVISYAACIAPKEYLNSAFNHNVKKLISTKAEDLTQAKLSSSVKTFDMLLAVSNSIDLRNDRWDLSMKFVKIFLDEQSVLQKKAYKYLTNIMPKIHYTFLPEVINILKTKQATQSSARPIRLTAISLIWKLNKFDEETEQSKVEEIAEFIQTFLPELIVGLRDSNSRSRKASQDLFKKITTKMLSLGLLNDFISMISAGLGAQSSLMKADSVVAVGYLLEKFGKSVDSAFIKEVNQIVLLLLKEQNKEIFKAVLVYLKKYMKMISKIELKVELPIIFNAIFETEQVIRDKYRSLTKQIVSRLIRKFTRPVVEQYVPEAHLRLIRGIIKEERYQKNKKLKEKLEKKKLVFQETDFDAQQKMEQEKMTKQSDEKNLLLKFDADQAQFHFVPNTGLKKMKEKLEEDLERKEVEYVKGKIVVREVIEDLAGKKRRREDRYATYDSILQEEREINEKETTIMTRTLTKKRGVHSVKESGVTFKAKGETGGDVVRKGKPDPYAFVQLNPKALNKRHQKRAAKAFDVIMNKKEEGALKGLKTNKKIKSN